VKVVTWEIKEKYALLYKYHGKAVRFWIVTSVILLIIGHKK